VGRNVSRKIQEKGASDLLNISSCYEILVSIKLPLVGLLTLVACGDRQVGERTRPSAIETAIARDLTARFGTSVAVSCLAVGTFPLKCTAKLGDGTELPIAIVQRKDAWDWQVDGVVVDTKAIVAYVKDGLSGIHVEQDVDCGPPVQVIPRGDRIVCKLARGGAAFVTLASDGTASLELALDPAAALARTELMTADKDRELAIQSKELEALAGQTDGEEATGDAGIATPSDGGTP
jgi:hypothetical protein